VPGRAEGWAENPSRPNYRHLPPSVAWVHACREQASRRSVNSEANRKAEPAPALDMIRDNAVPGYTVGADKNYDTAAFVAGCRERGCTPHGSQNNTHHRRRSMDGRRGEEPFGWMKAIGGLRKTRLRGRDLVEWFFILTATAYNLLRIPRILAG
jgi:hypothetical protein